MLRRTKIVATLGPATDDPKMLDRVIEAGVDVVRINFSHGTAAEHLQRAEVVRNRARAYGREVGVLVDLQGPKIRTECFRDGRVVLEDGSRFVLDADMDPAAGTAEAVGITYKDLPRDVKRGDTLVLDDGRVLLWVEAVEGSRIVCQVELGGVLSDHKGINRQGGGLSAGPLTDKDRADIKTAGAIRADYVALSFARHARDVEEAKALMAAAGCECDIVAKIERAEAMGAIEEILEAADAIMVARGDLGVEIGDAELPGVQKSLISMARARDRVVITATQMMESMINSPIPTRAEVLDVANAVLDGTDAVMLSAETAVGKYPHKAVAAMDRVCRAAERQRQARVSGHRIDREFKRVDEAIAMAAMYTANHLGVKAIVALTESGATPLWMSRISSGIPIFAFSRHAGTRGKVTLVRGVYPVEFDSTSTDHALVNKEAIDELLRRGAVRDGDLVVITKGDLAGELGGTNALKIVKVGSLVEPGFVTD